MVIDEIQLAPELLRPIRVAVDLDPTPGRFLLTESSRILALRTLPDALSGRMNIIELWPFSQGEIDGGADCFVDTAFACGPRLRHSFALRRRDHLERIVVGGFPEAVRRTPRRRAAFFDSYLTTLIERDVLELASIERQGELLKLLSLLAGCAGGLLVPGTLAGQSGIPRTTLVRYLHYRTKDRMDVDAVIETSNGRVIAVEVKSGATVRSEDLAGLRNLASKVGDRFVAGYVLYTGGQPLPFGEKLRAVPIDALWLLRA